MRRRGARAGRPRHERRRLRGARGLCQGVSLFFWGGGVPRNIVAHSRGQSYGAGADFVMSGSMFAAHDESGGELVERNGKRFKVFYGMSCAFPRWHGACVDLMRAGRLRRWRSTAGRWPSTARPRARRWRSPTAAPWRARSRTFSAGCAARARVRSPPSGGEADAISDVGASSLKEISKRVRVVARAAYVAGSLTAAASYRRRSSGARSSSTPSLRPTGTSPGCQRRTLRAARPLPQTRTMATPPRPARRPAPSRPRQGRVCVCVCACVRVCVCAIQSLSYHAGRRALASSFVRYVDAHGRRHTVTRATTTTSPLATHVTRRCSYARRPVSIHSLRLSRTRQLRHGRAVRAGKARFLKRKGTRPRATEATDATAGLPV